MLVNETFTHFIYYKRLSSLHDCYRITVNVCSSYLLCYYMIYCGSRWKQLISCCSFPCQKNLEKKFHKSLHRCALIFFFLFWREKCQISCHNSVKEGCVSFSVMKYLSIYRIIVKINSTFVPKHRYMLMWY